MCVLIVCLGDLVNVTLSCQPVFICVLLLFPGPNEAFQIDPIYGEVTTRFRLDREKISSYTLEILATDKVRVG